MSSDVKAENVCKHLPTLILANIGSCGHRRKLDKALVGKYKKLLPFISHHAIPLSSCGFGIGKKGKFLDNSKEFEEASNNTSFKWCLYVNYPNLASTCACSRVDN